MIHHANVRCDDCGTRHTSGNTTECIQQLQFQIVECKRKLEAFDEMVAALKEFLGLREWVIKAGGTEGPLEQDVIRMFALMQKEVVERAEAALKKVEELCAE